MNHRYESRHGIFKKEVVVGVTSWELKSHPFKALLLLTFMYGIEIWGSNLKNSHWKVFEKNVKMHMVSRIKVRSPTIYRMLLAEFKELHIELYTLKLTMGFQQWVVLLPPLIWSVKQPRCLDTWPNKDLTHGGVISLGIP